MLPTHLTSSSDMIVFFLPRRCEETILQTKLQSLAEQYVEGSLMWKDHYSQEHTAWEVPAEHLG